MLIKEWGRAKARLLRPRGLEPLHDADFNSNGEAALLRFIGRLPEIVRYDTVIDVGANVGDWTASALLELRGKGISNFFCVEPVPPFAAKIEQRFAKGDEVTLIREVFSREPGGQTEIFEIAGGGRLYQSYRRRTGPKATGSSKVAVPHKVSISSGDQHFADSSLRPYIIKIDCDGHDLHVLSGFERTLNSARPLVQFEYSDFWIAAGGRLREACALLRRASYRTYKMFPDRLVEFHFNRLFETFGYQNIVAVPVEFASVSAPIVKLS